MNKKQSRIISAHTGQHLEIEDKEVIEQKKRLDEITEQNKRAFEEAAKIADKLLASGANPKDISLKVERIQNESELEEERKALLDFDLERKKCLEKIGDFTNKPQNINSFVDPNEEEAVKKLITKVMQCPPPRMVGWQLGIKIHDTSVRLDEGGLVIDPKTGEPGRIIVTNSHMNAERYMKCVGQVVAMGQDCYSDERFHEGYTMIFGTRIPMRWIRKLFNRWMSPRTRWPLCKIGDWVVFPRYDGHQIKFKQHDIMFIEDAKIDCVVQDPTDISRE